MRESDLTESHQRVFQQMMQELAAGADPGGVELRRAVRRLANQYDAAEDEALRRIGVTGSRWALLLRLMGEEVVHARTDVSPSYLSRCLNVSRNTISALLGGLEDQGLVERSLDADDRRVFHIRLTEAGRAAIRETAPGHVSFLNHLVADLTADERAQLASLLSKLSDSLARNQAGTNPELTERTEARSFQPAIRTERGASSPQD